MDIISISMMPRVDLNVIDVLISVCLVLVVVMVNA